MRGCRVFCWMIFCLMCMGCLTFTSGQTHTPIQEEQRPVTLQQVSEVVETVMSILENGPFNDPQLHMESSLVSEGELELLLKFDGYDTASGPYEGFVRQTLLLDDQRMLAILLVMSIDTGSFCLDIDAMYDVPLSQYAYFSSCIDGRRAYERELSELLVMGKML